MEQLWTMVNQVASAGTALAVFLLFSPPDLHAQQVGGCPMFPPNNIWNTPIDRLPVDPASNRYIESGGATRNLHPDFSAAGGIPYNVVPQDQPMVPIALTSAESDPGPYPIPAEPALESGSDTHLLIVQQGACKLYEIFSASRTSDGGWRGSSGAVFDLRENWLRPEGWTSADAAGLAILPGLVRYEEILAGEIRHAIRVTVPRTRRAFLWPARHFASSSNDQNLPPMGQRFRLKADYDISPYPAEVQVLLRALKKYGMILADNGSSWFLTGVTDSRWNDDVWGTIKQIKGSDLEAVDASSLMLNPNSGAAGTPLTARRNEVPYSERPVFDLLAGSVQSITLTGAAVAENVVNLVDGQSVNFLICQDEQGGRSFDWPQNVKGGMVIGTSPSSCSAQQFISDGRNLYATSPGVIDLPKK